MTNLQAHITKKHDRWQSKITGNKQVSFVSNTQTDVYEKQRDSFANRNGGEIVVHGLNGKIRDKNTIWPMKDKFPPKG